MLTCSSYTWIRVPSETKNMPKTLTVSQHLWKRLKQVIPLKNLSSERKWGGGDVKLDHYWIEEYPKK